MLGVEHYDRKADSRRARGGGRGASTAPHRQDALPVAARQRARRRHRHGRRASAPSRGRATRHASWRGTTRACAPASASSRSAGPRGESFARDILIPSGMEGAALHGDRVRVEIVRRDPRANARPAASPRSSNASARASSARSSAIASAGWLVPLDDRLPTVELIGRRSRRPRTRAWSRACASRRAAAGSGGVRGELEQRARRRRRSRGAVPRHRQRARPAHRVSAGGAGRGGAPAGRPARRDLHGRARSARRCRSSPSTARRRATSTTRSVSRRGRAAAARCGWRSPTSPHYVRPGSALDARGGGCAAPASTSPTAPSRCCRRSSRPSCARSARARPAGAGRRARYDQRRPAPRRALPPRRHPQPRAADLHRRWRRCSRTADTPRSAPGAPQLAPAAAAARAHARADARAATQRRVARRLARPRPAGGAGRSLRGGAQHRRAARAAQRRAPADRGVHARGQPRRRRAACATQEVPLPVPHPRAARAGRRRRAQRAPRRRSGSHVAYDERGRAAATCSACSTARRPPPGRVLSRQVLRALHQAQYSTRQRRPLRPRVPGLLPLHLADPPLSGSAGAPAARPRARRRRATRRAPRRRAHRGAPARRARRPSARRWRPSARCSI